MPAARRKTPELNPQGIYLPVSTPFQASGGVDTDAFRRNLTAWLEHPIAGVVVAGSTGEAPILERSELLELVEAARRATEDRWIVAGTGSESTRRTIRWTVEVAAAGADAVLVRAPHYYLPAMTPVALHAYFTAVADASPVPVILYHIPKFVPVEIVPELVGELIEHPNIVGIKDSSGDLKSLGALTTACDGRGSVLVGSGAHLYPALELGASGGVLGVGLLAPAMACELYEAWQVGRQARAGKLQERLGPLHKRVVAQLGVPGVKAALDLLGLDGGPPRSPLLPLPERRVPDVEAALAAAGVLQPSGPAHS